MQRRQFIQMLGAGAAATTLVGCGSAPINAKGAKVIVVGGGYGLSLIHISEPTRRS